MTLDYEKNVSKGASPLRPFDKLRDRRLRDIKKEPQ